MRWKLRAICVASVKNERNCMTCNTKKTKCWNENGDEMPSVRDREETRSIRHVTQYLAVSVHIPLSNKKTVLTLYCVSNSTTPLSTKHIHTELIHKYICWIGYWAYVVKFPPSHVSAQRHNQTNAMARSLSNAHMHIFRSHCVSHLWNITTNEDWARKGDRDTD